MCAPINTLICTQVGGDQGLLNSYFGKWKDAAPEHRIPFVYNVTFTASYGYLPALHHFRDQVVCVHFIGSEGKPWMYHRDANGKVLNKSGLGNVDYVQLWWKVHDERVKGLLLSSGDKPVFAGFYNVH